LEGKKTKQMKVLKIVILVVLGLLILLFSLFILGLGATGHKVPSSTYFWLLFWIFLFTISFLFTNYYFNYRESQIKLQLKKIAFSLPNFTESLEYGWFQEYFQNSKWSLALESIEYYISENNVSIDHQIEKSIENLHKRRFL
jgi:drug/metabolite transporter (DMT)-like permease